MNKVIQKYLDLSNDDLKVLQYLTSDSKRWLTNTIKEKLKTDVRIWHLTPLKKFPNAWEEEGAKIINGDKSLLKYIDCLMFEEREDYKKLSNKKQNEFLGKFYNINGNKSPLIQSCIDKFYDR